MESQETTARLTPDDRDALVAAAAGSARRNQPRALVYAALALVLVSVVYLAVSIASYGAARAGAAQAASTFGRVKKTAEDLAERMAQRERGVEREDVCEPDMRITSTIQNIAIESGLERPAVPSPRTETRDGVRRSRYVYTLRQAATEPAGLLGFVERVLNEIDCTGVNRLDLRPVQQSEWEMTVEFQRLERAS